MTQDLQQFISEVRQVTGAAGPAVLESDSPVLDAAVEKPGASEGLYLIGLIGGKDVGKSAMVNALVGEMITAETSHGAGTEIAIAYVHESRLDELSAMLEQCVPGKFRVVTHRH